MDMGRGKRMRCIERITWKLTLSYVKQTDNRNLLYGSENSKRDSVSSSIIPLERWGGEGHGKEVQKGGDIYIPLADSC